MFCFPYTPYSSVSVFCADYASQSARGSARAPTTSPSPTGTTQPSTDNGAGAVLSDHEEQVESFSELDQEKNVLVDYYQFVFATVTTWCDMASKRRKY